jgi:hypothetical protein
MSKWFLEQWRDIKGNFKWAVVCLAGGGVAYGFSAFKHGLLPWQHVVLAACFSLTLAWALIATWVANHATPPPLQSGRQSAGNSPLDQPSPISPVLPTGSAAYEEPYLKRTTICLNYRPNLNQSHYEKAFSSKGDVLYISVMSQDTLKRMRSRLNICRDTETKLRVLTWHHEIPKVIIEAYGKHLREQDLHPERFVSQARQAASDWRELQTEYSDNLEVREYSSVATMQGIIVKRKWAMVELIPYATVTTDRPALLLTPDTDPEVFALLVDRFDQLWKNSQRLI